MKVSVSTNFTIADETNPTDVRFSSGNKSFSDSTSYAESESSTFSIAAGADDVALQFGSVQEAELLYLFCKEDGLTLKLTPTGGGTPIDMELVPNVPAVIPMRLSAVSVSNTSGSIISLVYSIAGN